MISATEGEPEEKIPPALGTNQIAGCAQWEKKNDVVRQKYQIVTSKSSQRICLRIFLAEFDNLLVFKRFFLLQERLKLLVQAFLPLLNYGRKKRNQNLEPHLW